MINNNLAFGNIDSNACRTNPPQIQNRDGSQAISHISYGSALVLFAEIQKSKHRLSYLEAENNCENRAHLISELFYKQNQLSTVKVFIQTKDANSANSDFGATGAAFMNGDDNNIRLTPTSEVSGRAYSWDYHTATAICVQKDGRAELYIFDPSLFSAPVPLIRWQNHVTEGLSSIQYESYSTSMYNISRLDQTIASPRHTSFTSANSRLVRQSLRTDWRAHTQALRRLNSKSTNITPLPQNKLSTDATD